MVTNVSSNPSHLPVMGNQALKTLSFALNRALSQQMRVLEKLCNQSRSWSSDTMPRTPVGNGAFTSASIPIAMTWAWRATTAA
jgi:hypothetical protein